MLGFCFSNISIYAKSISNSELASKIEDLQKRILLLEKIIFVGNSQVKEVQADKAIWRKLVFGMDAEEVRSLLGEPDEITVLSRDFIVWSYPNDGHVRFNNSDTFSWD